MTLADVTISSHQPPEHELHVPMSEEEYLDLHIEYRAEWANGEAIMMAPDNFDHVDLVGWLGRVLAEFAEARDLGKVLINNFETHLPAGSRRVPDNLFISKDRLNLITPNRLEGAPDLAIEVVSPDSVSRDYREKFLEYETSGVREYWIIDLLAKKFEPYALVAGSLQKIPMDGERIRSTVLTGLYIKPAWIWQNPRPRVLTLLKELGIT